MNKLPFEIATRKVLTKRETPTDQTRGCEPNKRPIKELIKYGVVNIDKPRGPTSHQVSAYVQKILGISKSGHSGTLDPNVTGVLPTALSRATKVAHALLTAGKEYVGIMHLHKPVDEPTLKKAIREFTGIIDQLPPRKSAVKREERERNIYYFEILEIADNDVLFRVGCQAGTYIRKLCHDIGEKLGVGAHMAELRRTKAGPFSEETLATLQDLQDAWWYFQNKADEKPLRKIIQPVERAVAHLPKVWVLDSAVQTLCHGADLKMPGVAKIETDIEKGTRVAVMTLKGELIALGDAQMTSIEILEKEKGIAVKIEKVFMEPDVYKPRE